MEKKNVIFILIDSVFQEHIKSQLMKKSPMPFIQSLAKEGVQAENLYSQAPFTEAALTPLLSGEPLLNKGAYMNRLRYRKTMLQTFEEQGYETFINHYYPSIYPSAMFPGTTTCYYVNPFDFMHVWEYRLEYYQPLFLKKELSDDELVMIYDILDDNFKAWIKQYKFLLNRDECVSMMQLRMNYNDSLYDESLKILSKEYKKFKENSYVYLKNLYEVEKEHILFKIETLVLNHKLNDEARKRIHDRYISKFKKIYKLNFQRNLCNTKFPLGRVVQSLCNRKFQDAYQYVAMYQNCIIDKDLYNRIEGKFDMFKPQISAQAYLDHASTWISQRDSKSPFFLYLHLDDAHWPESFFSFDIEDITTLAEEFSVLDEYLNSLSKKYHGALTMDLSLRYIDHCIEKFYKKVMSLEQMKDTIFVITADHGFSFGYQPLRTNYVNNLYKENYNTPFILHDGKHVGICKTKYFGAYDVAPTILDAANLENSNAMYGESMLKSEGRAYAISEYMGGGCPDMIRRNLILTVRTDCYSVAIELPLCAEFDHYELRHVFNLKKDPLEYHNMAKKIDKQAIKTELDLLNKRFHEIKEDFVRYQNAFHK